MTKASNTKDQCCFKVPRLEQVGINPMLCNHTKFDPKTWWSKIQLYNIYEVILKYRILTMYQYDIFYKVILENTWTNSITILFCKTNAVRWSFVRKGFLSQGAFVEGGLLSEGAFVREPYQLPPPQGRLITNEKASHSYRVGCKKNKYIQGWAEVFRQKFKHQHQKLLSHRGRFNK